MAGWTVILIRGVTVVLVLIFAAARTALAQYDDEPDYAEASTQPEISTAFVPEFSTPPTQAEGSTRRSFHRSRTVDFSFEPFVTSTHPAASDLPTGPESRLTSSSSLPMTSLAPRTERSTEAAETATPEVVSTTVTDASTGGVPHTDRSTTEHRITLGHVDESTSERYDESALHAHTQGAAARTLLTSRVTSQSVTSENDPHFVSSSFASTLAVSHQLVSSTPSPSTETQPPTSPVWSETIPQSTAISMAPHPMGNRTAAVATSTTELTSSTMSLPTQTQSLHIPVTSVLYGQSTRASPTVSSEVIITHEATLGSSVDEREIVSVSTPIAAVTEATGRRVTTISGTSAAPARSRTETDLTPTSSEEVSSVLTEVSPDGQSTGEAALPNITSSSVENRVENSTTLPANTSQPMIATGHPAVSMAASSPIAAVITTSKTTVAQPTSSTRTSATGPTITTLPPSSANTTRPSSASAESSVNSSLAATTPSRINSTATAAFASIVNSTGTTYTTNYTATAAAIPRSNSTAPRTDPPEINSTITTTTTDRTSTSRNVTTRIISRTATTPTITTTAATTQAITTTLSTPTITTTRMTPISRTPVVPRTNQTTNATRRTAVTRTRPATTTTSTATVTSTMTSATTSATKTTLTMEELESITTDVRYMLTLTGDCRVVLNNTEYFQRFLHGFHDLIVRHLKITEKYTLGEISCGSVHVYVTFQSVLWPDFDVMLQSAIRNGGPGLALPVWMDTSFVTFELARAKRVPLDPTGARTYNVITEVMDDVDIVVIIVACCVCGVLIAIGVIICAKECYRRKHAQTFNLLEVPHLNVKPEDFTLTRIPRPRAVYSDPGSAPQTQKGFAELDGESPSTRVLNLSSGNPSCSLPGKGDSGRPNGRRGISPSDLHLRVKEHSDGLLVGVTTTSTYYAPASNGVNSSHHNYTHHHHHSVHSEVQNGTASQYAVPRKPRLRTPTEDVPRCGADDSPASQRLLDSTPRCPDDQGNLNPVYAEERLESRDVAATEEGH